MAKKGALHFINLSKNFISSELTLKKYRNNVKDFTRKRKLSFEGLSLCMMRLLRQNIQVEIYTYFSALNHAGTSNQISFTSSAFVQSRKKMKPDMFYDLSRIIAEDFYRDNDENVRFYKGHRLLGIDGSTINLPVNDMTKQVYGTFNNQKQTNDVVLGRVSIMYDVLNEIVIDGKLCPYKTGEIPLSQEHFKLAKENDIIIMDRGYPGFKSMYEMQKRGIHFLYRCKTNFSNKIKEFYASKKQEAVVEIKPKQNGSVKHLPYNKETTIRVRLIRIELASGETEILITSLLDKTKYTYSDFKELYYKRWGIEVYYNRLKNIIGVENFSGNSDQFIQQEFNCALYMSNMLSILTKQANKRLMKSMKAENLSIK